MVAIATLLVGVLIAVRQQAAANTGRDAADHRADHAGYPLNR
jgi:hypothetical protein